LEPYVKLLKLYTSLGDIADEIKDMDEEFEIFDVSNAC
jgi:hypothetical protein